MRISAVAEPYCSQQPRFPQPQSCPPGWITMCPASMPAPPKPVYSLPPRTMPLPIPVPRVTTTAGSQPRAEPAQNSPMAAQSASLPR